MEKVIQQIKGYFGIANRAGYIIWGADNLKNYKHKIYLVLYREDGANTILKSVENLKQICQNIIMLSVQNMNDICGMDNCKLCAIKNKGLAEKIQDLLRSNNIGK